MQKIKSNIQIYKEMIELQKDTTEFVIYNLHRLQDIAENLGLAKELIKFDKAINNPNDLPPTPKPKITSKKIIKGVEKVISKNHKIEKMKNRIKKTMTKELEKMYK